MWINCLGCSIDLESKLSSKINLEINKSKIINKFRKINIVIRG